jgi:hypothetical protein
MDLTFAELDEYDFKDSGFNESHNFNNNNFNNEIINVNSSSNLTTYTNYWHKNNEQSNNISKNTVTMKTLTYDDILNSLNLKAKDGNLEFIEKQNKQEPIKVKKQNVRFDPSILFNNVNQNQTQNLNQNLNQNQTQNQNVNVKKQQEVPVPQLHSADKNSYIYNKYFKDYKDESVVDEPKKPMTREEYIQEYNRRIYEKRRVEQIKSKKLMFSRGNDVSISISNPHHNLNKLFRM